MTAAVFLNRPRSATQSVKTVPATGYPASSTALSKFEHARDESAKLHWFREVVDSIGRGC